MSVCSSKLGVFPWRTSKTLPADGIITAALLRAPAAFLTVAGTRSSLESTAIPAYAGPSCMLFCFVSGAPRETSRSRFLTQSRAELHSVVPSSQIPSMDAVRETRELFRFPEYITSYRTSPIVRNVYARKRISRHHHNLPECCQKRWGTFQPQNLYRL